jgi:NDP-sugar pyrophosphorylase family protein
MKFIVTQFRTLVACGLMLFAGVASAAEPITDLPKAMAKAQGKPMFIYVFDSL